MKRTLGVLELTALGIGAIIGAGIFSSTGAAAAGNADHVGAGPALVVSYVLTAVACGFAALCYAEMASMIPIPASAYTYAYVTLGELFAWIIGWDLILEYAVGNVAVAVSWSGYFSRLPRRLRRAHAGWLTSTVNQARRPPRDLATPRRTCSASPIVLQPAGGRHRRAAHRAARRRREGVGARQHRHGRAQARAGASRSSLVGAFWVTPDNWHPFAPNGFTGIMTGASIIFFAYIGFDAISTTAEEAKNPQRDLPDRHDRVARDLHDPLHRGHRRARPAWSRRAELGVADPLALALQNAGLDAAGRRVLVRRGHRDDRGAAGVPARPAAHLHVDGARRPAAA